MKKNAVFTFVAGLICSTLFSSAGKINDQNQCRPNIEPPNIFVVRQLSLSTGVTVEYAEQGDKTGIPVILLHGITDSWHSFEKVLPMMDKKLHVYALSLRGHGNSGKPIGGYNMPDFAADVAAFIRENNLGSAFLVGHSMSGLVVQQFALNYPQFTRGLVLIDSDASFSMNPGMPEFHESVLKLEDPVAPEFASEFQKATLNKPIDDSWFESLVNESLKLPARIWKAAMNGLMEADFTAELKNIQKPTLIFWGEKDAFCML